MTKKTKYVGWDQGAPRSSQWLSPKNPQTGDGRTTRNIFDAIKVVFRKGSGKRV